MTRRIDFDDLLERVSGNAEFANRMMKSFFSDWESRVNNMDACLNEEKYDELADGAHQLKGILGNLSINKGFELLKSIHTEAKLKNPRQLLKLMKKLRTELERAESFYLENITRLQ